MSGPGAFGWGWGLGWGLGWGWGWGWGWGLGLGWLLLRCFIQLQIRSLFLGRGSGCARDGNLGGRGVIGGGVATEDGKQQ